MAYEIFFGAADQRRMLAQPAMVFGQACLAIQLAGEALVKQLRLQVGELVVFPQAMRNVDTQGYFNAFQCIQHEQPQFLIEHI